MGNRPILADTIQTLPGAIGWWAERTPEAPALQTLDRPTVTYRDLHRAIRRGAARLSRFGIEREDRIAVVLGDGLDPVVALLTAMSAAGAAPLSVSQTPRELERDLRRLNARLIIVDPDRTPDLAELASVLGTPVLTVSHLTNAYPESGADWETTSFSDLDVDPDATMLIAHTSGTTALPKRVPITHRMQLAAARARNSRREFGPDDAGLLLAPIASVMFLTNLITMLVSGGNSIVFPGLAPLPALRAFRDLQPTWVLAGLPLYNAMLQALERDTNLDLDANTRLRFVSWGGAGADPAFVERLTLAFGVCPDSTYGLSEASAVAVPGRAGQQSPRSVGRAAACAIRITGDDGQELGAGERGYIEIRGPSLFTGYLDDPEATAAAFTADGWFRTGDLGHLDSSGALFLGGRITEQINRGGVKIAPAEVESILLAHPAVIDAAVFAVPDAVLGEEAVAAVVLEPGRDASARDLRAWMLDRLTIAKSPRRIWFVTALPRTETGKVQRGELTRRWMQQAR